MSDINRRIAELKGWKVIRQKWYQTVPQYDLDYLWLAVDPDGKVVDGYLWQNEDDAYHAAPDYEHDLNAAIELLKDLNATLSYEYNEWVLSDLAPRETEIHRGDNPVELIATLWLATREQKADTQ